MTTAAEDSVDCSQVAVLTSSKSAGSSLSSVDEHRTTGQRCCGLTSRHCTNQHPKLNFDASVSLGHFLDLGELSLWSLSKLYHEPSFPWQLPCWWGGFCPLGLVSFHFQKPFSLDLVSSLLQNLPAACPTELSLFHPVLQDLLLFRWWSQPCLEKTWSLQWESSVYSPWRPQGAGKKL